jgi:hypothetical protein
MYVYVLTCFYLVIDRIKIRMIYNNNVIIVIRFKFIII